MTQPMYIAIKNPVSELTNSYLVINMETKAIQSAWYSHAEALNTADLLNSRKLVVLDPKRKKKANLYALK